jgi:hypothetical protein
MEKTVATPNSELALKAAQKGLDLALKGQWTDAHDEVQIFEEDPFCCWIHAAFHRWEGDLNNSAYWYHQAEQEMPAKDFPLNKELQKIKEALGPVKRSTLPK